MIRFENYAEELRAIELAYGMTAYMGMSVKNVYFLSIEKHWDMYQLTGEEKYLILAVLVIRAYLTQGYVYAEKAEFFDAIIKAANITYEEIRPTRLQNTIRVDKLTREKIRSMIHRWPASKGNAYTMSGLVEEIYNKIMNKEEGHFCYLNESKSSAARSEAFELVVTGQECYLHDMKRGVYYQFSWGKDLC